MRPVAILFDIDGTLVSTGGAGGEAGVGRSIVSSGFLADIGSSSNARMTDPQVARSTFQTVPGRPVNDREMARMMAGYLERLPIEVETSAGYRVLEGVSELLPRLCRDGFLPGLTTGALEAAAHIKLARGDLNKLFCFGGTARTRQTDPHP